MTWHDTRRINCAVHLATIGIPIKMFGVYYFMVLVTVCPTRQTLQLVNGNSK